jgi:uncharacterized protein HemX
MSEITPQKTRKPSFAWRSLITWLIVLALAGGLLFTWLRLDRLENESKQRGIELSARTTALETQGKQIQDAARELTNRATAVEARLTEAANSQAQLEKLYSNRSSDEVDSLLGDIEQSVSLANQQLLGSGQVSSALLLLQDADRGASKSKNPNIQLIHRLLLKDIEKLKAAPLVDVAQLSLRLDTISQAVEKMPLMTDMVADVPNAGSSNKPEGRNLWIGELQRLFRVHRVDDPASLLMTPEQGFFVRQNARISLASARLALFSRNEAMFKSDLKKTESALRTYFDARNPKVATQIASLEQLSATRIAVELPTLAETLSAVRSVRSQR